MSTLVYRNGITRTKENAELVDEQMRLAHNYRNMLVQIERARRTVVRQATAEASQEIRECETRVRETDALCEKLAGAIRSKRKGDRKRSESQADREELKVARERKREAVKQLYAARNSLRTVCKECSIAEDRDEKERCPHATDLAIWLRNQLDNINERASAWQRSARENSGVYWGTYLMVESAMQASRGAPLYEIDGVTPHDPKFIRWSGDGFVAVQLQGGLSISDALSCEDSRLRIKEPPYAEAVAEMLPEDPGDLRDGRMPPGYHPITKQKCPVLRPDGTPSRWARKDAARHGELHMRVGSDGRSPIWATWRLDYARPLPPGGIIKWAAVHRRMRGTVPEWSLCVTIDTGACQPMEIPSGRIPAVAIDVGWRKIGQELRVAAWCDDTGQKGELRLSAEDIACLKYPEEVRSRRDMTFDLLKLRLRKLLDTSDRRYLPEWLPEATQAMDKWRDPRRAVALYTRWTKDRAGRDSLHLNEEIAYSDLEAWTQGDRFLWNQEASSRIHALRRRREIYRVFASNLAKQYDTVVLERFDLRDIAVREEVGSDSATNEVARSNRFVAAISELRVAILNGCRTRGSQVVAVDAADSTRTCPACGVVEKRDAAASVTLVCECGQAWDQDTEGAAPFLLRSFRERPGDAKVLVSARGIDNGAEPLAKKEGRFARAKKQRQQKERRMETARKSGSNVAE